MRTNRPCFPKTRTFLILLMVLLMGSWVQAQISILDSQAATINNAAEGDLYKTTDTNRLFIGLQPGTLWEIGNNSSSSQWMLNGNSGIPNGSFLGTTDDRAMEIRSNNLGILRFGRRQTLGLTQGYTDYDNNDQPLVYLGGNGTISALQFAASGADFYKPMFFTTTNGSFRLKGSSGGTDFFELGSAGPSNNGRLEFIIGDDGQEPIVFKRYDYRDQSHIELFRVQGSGDVADAQTRFGININPTHQALGADYYNSSSDGNMANSTLQVGGSVSTAIVRVNSDITLTEEHHTVILTTSYDCDVTLPNANSCMGRVYIIKNICGSNQTISTYRTDGGGTSSTITNGRCLILQSDGVEWQQILRD